MTTKTKSLWTLAAYENGFAFKPEDFSPTGIPIIRIRQLVDPSAEVDLTSRQPPSRYLLKDGDLVFSWSGSVAVQPWNRGPAWLNQHLYKVIPSLDIDQRWLRWTIESSIPQLLGMMHGSAMTHLTHDMLKQLTVNVPRLVDQQRIATFLDAEVAKIDHLAASQIKMIELLTERRVSVISHLIYGRNQIGQKIESTIPTVGSIPSSWQITRVKTFMREVIDLSSTGSEELLTVSHLTGVTPRSEKDVNMFLAESMVGYKRCIPGDLVINTLWAWMGALGVSRNDGIVSPAYGIYRFTSDIVDPDYLDLLVKTPEYVTEMTRFSKGVWTSRLRLYPESFLSLKFTVPPRAKQRQIVEEIKAETKEQEKLRSTLEIFSQKLVERRQALIAAAVTGRITV